jgi:hypothetical protein
LDTLLLILHPSTSVETRSCILRSIDIEPATTLANKLVAEISRPDLEEISRPASASITDVRHLASYNWVDAATATPTIAVPGSPDLWSPPNLPFKLNKDTGHIYIAQNAARHSESPLEPLFRESSHNETKLSYGPDVES